MFEDEQQSLLAYTRMVGVPYALLGSAKSYRATAEPRLPSQRRRRSPVPE
jgi:hypothetical protein